MAGIMLAQRGLVLFKLETEFDEDALPDALNDALLVGEPTFTPDITQLERNNVKDDLSPEATTTGRKIGQMTFLHEVRNNGNLDGTLPPLVGRCIQACGFEETLLSTAADTVGATEKDVNNTGDMEFLAGATAYAGTVIRDLRIEIMTGGGSGVAVARITAPAQGDGTIPAIDMTDTGEVTLQDGVGFPVQDTLGGTVVELVPDFQSTDPAGGDVYNVRLTPLGVRYTPVSKKFASGTVYLYLPDEDDEALLIPMTGCRGTFSVEATGGEYATFSFTFTGSYVSPSDTTFPADPAYETQKPQQVELAGLSVRQAFPDVDDPKNFLLRAGAFTMDMQVDVQIRSDVNSSDAYAGAIIVDRAPILGFDPESVLEQTHPFWRHLEDGDGMEWNARVGSDKGNVVLFRAQNAQYTNLTFGNRNSIRTYEVQGNMARVNGDDEVEIVFA